MIERRLQINLQTSNK